MDDPLIGKTIGPCRLARRIAKGGMGIIYEGCHLALDKRVAVKVLDPLFASDAAFVERFIREARAAAKLDHPNIVQVLDVGGEQGTFYIVMQLIDGVALDAIADRAGRMGLEPATKLIREIARGLDAAHKQGVIHRDVKPANVLVQKDGAVKITDFGLARIGGPPTAGSTRLTAEGSFMGTPEYVSPEQAKGGFIDKRADLYSLGITFYRLLAGDVPFRAESAVELAYKHIHETPVPIERKVPGLDPRVTRLIASLLAKDPGQRPPDAGAVIRVLDEVIAKPMPAPAYHPMKPPTTVPPPRNVPPPTPIMRPTTPLPPLPPRPMERREAPAVPLVLFVVFLLLAAALAAAPAVRGPTPGLDGPFRSTDPGFPRRAGLLVGSALAYIAALVAFRRELAKSGAGGAVGLVLLLSLAGVYATAMAPARPAAKPLLLAAGAALSLYGFLIGCRRNLSEWLAWLGRALLVLGVASLYAFAARGGPIGPWPLLAGGIAAGLLGTYLITSADSDAGRRVLGLLLYLAGAGALFYFASAGDAPPPEWTARAAARFSSYPADLLSRETLAVATAAAAAGSAWALIEGIARYRRYYS